MQNNVDWTVQVRRSEQEIYIDDTESIINVTIRFDQTDDKYRSHGNSAKLNPDSRKRSHADRGDRAIKPESSWPPRTHTRPNVAGRSDCLPSPTYKTPRRQFRMSPNDCKELYKDSKRKVPEVYEAKPVSYGEPTSVENKPTAIQDKQKVQRNLANDEEMINRDDNDEENASIERFNELSPLMSSMVEDELKHIMIKYWLTLPDGAPTNEADKFVVDKLKNEIADDLRNTIGLNVTKRLLNVHNNVSSNKGLLIKIQLQSLASSTNIKEFAKKYDITTLKYIQKQTYVGRLTSWAELDELLAVKDLRCGNARVTVTPVYNFLKCPPTLKTVFDGNHAMTTKEMEKEQAKKINESKKKPIVTADQVLAEDAKKRNAKEENKTSQKAAVNQAKTDSKAPKNVSPKAEDKKLSAPKLSETSKLPKEQVQNESKTNTKITSPTVIVAKKAAITTDINKDKPAAKVEPAKSSYKPPAQTNTTAKETVTHKPIENKTVSKNSKVGNPIKVDPKTVKAPAKPAVKALETSELAKEVIVKGDDRQDTKSTKTVAENGTNSVPPKTIAKEQTKPIVKEPTKPIAKEPIKPIAKEPTKPIAKEPTKPIAKEPTKPIRKEPTKPIAKEQTKQNAKEPAKPIVKEPAKPIAKEPTKQNPTKVSVNTKPTTAAKKQVPSKPTEQKTVTKTSPKVASKTATPIKGTKDETKAKRNEHDFEELNDHDILAMLSGGIVLDECSGSDEE